MSTEFLVTHYLFIEGETEKDAEHTADLVCKDIMAYTDWGLSAQRVPGSVKGNDTAEMAEVIKRLRAHQKHVYRSVHDDIGANTLPKHFDPLKPATRDMTDEAVGHAYKLLANLLIGAWTLNSMCFDVEASNSRLFAVVERMKAAPEKQFAIPVIIEG